MKKSPNVRTFNVEEIESPEFLKQLNIDELEALCESIRKFIIESVSKTGGHLSSNLGAVEAIVAMHYVFSSPKDKFLFDVSHQAYTHKILTGRAKEFKNLRQKDGLSGFASYKESKHDVLETGHSSTTISAACGFLEAKEVNSEIGDVIAFIGDGSIENGLAFEGLNYLGSQKNQKLIIIINDNEMSISKNVGRLAKSFSKMRIKRGYNGLKRHTPMFIRRGLSRLVSSFRTFVYGSDIFTSMGYKYFGPIDGNNIKEMIEYLRFAKNCSESVILKINTIKGKGYTYAEDDKEGRWHGVGKFDVASGEVIKDSINKSWSKGISEILDKKLEENKNIRIISPATLVGSSLSSLKEKYPNEVIDVGINEEHAVVMASAMARNGIIPVVSIYSTFLQRSYDYLVNDIDRTNTHVVFLIDRAGLVAGDGSTHQGIFDIAMMLPLPNFKIAMPSNNIEAKALIDYAIKEEGPIAIRYPKCDIEISSGELTIDSPKWLILNEISDVNLLTYGDYVNEFKDFCNEHHIGLINALFIKPLDLEILRSLNNKKVIVLEEVIKNASLSSEILVKINEEKLNIKVEAYNVNDYPDIGTRLELQKDFKVDFDSIKEKILK